MLITLPTSGPEGTPAVIDRFLLLFLVSPLQNQFWGTRLKKNIGKIEQIQRRATKTVQGLRHKTCQERLGELNVPSPENRREMGDMIGTFKYIKGVNKVPEGGIFKY